MTIWLLQWLLRTVCVGCGYNCIAGETLDGFIDQTLQNPQEQEDDDGQLALSLLRRGNALLDEESEEGEAEGIEDTEPIPRPSTDSTSGTRVAAGQQTESFSRRVNKRNDKSYIGQMVEMEEAFLLKQDTVEQQEHEFRNSLLRVLEAFANGFTALVSLEEERRRHEETLLQLTKRMVTAREEEVKLKRQKLDVLSSSRAASDAPLDTVTGSDNSHDKESVPPFTQSTVQDEDNRV